jgi:hypothetical protein
VDGIEKLDAPRDILHVINLDSDTYRYATIEPQVAAIGYECWRVGAVRGLYLPDLLVSRIPGADTVQKGTLGCFLSHVAAWEAILKSGEPAGFVVEDDSAIMPWFPRGIIGVVAGSGFDLVMCNQRIQADKQFEEDLRGEPLRYSPLLDNVLARPFGYRAPGGEGYCLSANGARLLVENVQRGGIHGDVDWFIVMCGLTPEERGHLAPGTSAIRNARRIRRNYPGLQTLRAAVMSPYLVRHGSRDPEERKRSGSSRKKDNDLGLVTASPITI